ncbi:12198_t:CDS:2, partial [Entrophospora sp. SA101]
MVIANLKALAYNILKEFKDPIVSGKDLSELNCSECDKKIISSPHIKYFTTLKCGHTFHRLCLKKKILLAYPNVCPYPNCNEKLDLIEFPRCDSESKDDEEDDSALQSTDPKSNTVTTATTNPDTIANTSSASILPSKHVGDPTSADKPTSKKAKKQSKKEESPTLKKLIEELTTTAPENFEKIIEVGENTNNFLYHYSKITHAESKSEIANGEVIECYFNF